MPGKLISSSLRAVWLLMVHFFFLHLCLDTCFQFGTPEPPLNPLCTDQIINIDIGHSLHAFYTAESKKGNELCPAGHRARVQEDELKLYQEM